MKGGKFGGRRWWYVLGAGAVLTIILGSGLLFIVSLQVTSPQNLRNSLEIPLKYHSGWYLIDIKIAEKEGWMILDTGADLTLFCGPTLEELGVQARRGILRTTFFPFLNREVLYHSCNLRNLTIGGFETDELTVGVTVEKFPARIHARVAGKPILGVLGYDFLRRWKYVTLSTDKMLLSNFSYSRNTNSFTFELISLDGLPMIIQQTKGGTPFFCVVDTGSVSHYLSAEIAHLIGSRGRIYKVQDRPVSTIAYFYLNDRGGARIPFIAVAKPANVPPFIRHRTISRCILGSGLLKRFDIVFDHHAGFLHLIPVSKKSHTGTYGLLVFSEDRHNEIYTHFVIPYPNTDAEFGKIELVDNQPVYFWDKDKLINRLLMPKVGETVYLRVRTSGGKHRNMACSAFAPEEIGMKVYKADTRIRIKSRVSTISHSILHVDNHLWLYPFDLWSYSSDLSVRRYLPMRVVAVDKNTGINRVTNLVHREPEADRKSSYEIEMSLKLVE